jgi:transposase
LRSGKVKLVGISRYVANRRRRAVLIQGARAYVYRLKEPKTAKDRWLWAMLTQNTEYQRYPLAA